MKPIITERLILRNWENRDRDVFHHINNDETVMEFFPFRRDRTEADAMLDRLRTSIEELGFGFAAIELKATGGCLGFCGLAMVMDTPPLPDGSIEIGWRLTPQAWGKGLATEAARAWLGYGFQELGFNEIISFAVSDNHRSIAVMKRLGMERQSQLDFNHPHVPDIHAHLRPHVVYRLTRANWQSS